MFRSNLVIGLTIFVTVILVAIFASWIAHYDPVSHSTLLYAEEPPSAKFWFGTDDNSKSDCCDCQPERSNDTALQHISHGALRRKRRTQIAGCQTGYIFTKALK